MANLRVSLRKKGASNFETGDKILPETDWGFILNKPATFVPDPHNHTIAQITGLQGVLDGKAPSTHNHNWSEVTGKPSWIGTLKPSYDLSEVAETTIYKRVTQTEKNTWNGKQNALGYTPENAANKRTSIRVSGATNTSYVSELGVKNYVDSLTQDNIGDGSTYKRVTENEKIAWSFKASITDIEAKISEYDSDMVTPQLASKQDALGYTPVPNTRTIAGLDLTANRTRDAILGVSTNGYYRRTGANTYDIRTVANLKSDLGLGSAAYTASTAYKPAGYTPTWSEITSKPSVIIEGDSRLTNSRPASDVHPWAKSENIPSYDLSQISETTIYKRVTQSEKNAWNAKQDQAQVEAIIGSFETDIIIPQLNQKLSSSLKGSANGLAELDANGKVPLAQLPSFVEPVYTQIFMKDTLGTFSIPNYTKYSMYLVHILIVASSIEVESYQSGFISNDNMRFGAPVYDMGNQAMVYINASVSGNTFRIDDTGQMPWGMISGTKAFQVTLWGVEFKL